MIAISTYSGECDGLGLAAEMAGIEVAAYCEEDPKRRARLAKKHPGKPIFESDEELTADALRAYGIHADFLFGGPPCQPFSVAGAQRAEDDPRHRWPQMLRFIQEYRPRWVLVENVGGFVNLALDLVCDDLEDEGYEVGAVVLPALAIGAPHRRDRCFVVGHAHGGELRKHSEDRGKAVREIDEVAGASKGMAHGSGHRRGEGGAELPGFGGISELAGGGGERMAYRPGDRRDSGGDFVKAGQLSHQPDRKYTQGECKRNGRVCGAGEDGGAGCCMSNTQGKQRDWRMRPRRRRPGFTDSRGVGNAEGIGRNPRAELPILIPAAQPGSISGSKNDFWRAAESRLGRVLDGVSHRLDEVKWPAWRGQAQHLWEPPRTAKNILERPRRIESLGLAVVPWQVYPLMALIREMDDILRGQTP